MTDTQSQGREGLVAVEQRHREAGVKVFEWYFGRNAVGRSGLLNGGNDGHTLIQTFARFERDHMPVRSENPCAALTPLPDTEGWQPIETAPNGKMVLVYCARFEAVCEAHNYEHAGWKTFGVNGVWNCRPTHWRPLPAPPSIDGMALKDDAQPGDQP